MHERHLTRAEIEKLLDGIDIARPVAELVVEDNIPTARALTALSELEEDIETLVRSYERERGVRVADVRLHRAPRPARSAASEVVISVETVA